MKPRIVAFAFLSFFLAVPMFGETYKTTYSMPCSDLWGAVKDTLSYPDNYTVVSSDDAKMTVKYKVKHAVHISISGALLQRDNRVTLIPKTTGCEMQVVSNYSGLEHNDQGDFKQRVEESLAKPKAAKPTGSAKPDDPAK